MPQDAGVRSDLAETDPSGPAFVMTHDLRKSETTKLLSQNVSAQKDWVWAQECPNLPILHINININI